MQQVFIDATQQQFTDLERFPGTRWVQLAELAEQGSLHRLKMCQGSVIPVHTHPADEFVYVLSGTVKTGERICAAGTFWKTPAGVRQGPHEALTDVEILTIRLGAMGAFEDA